MEEKIKKLEEMLPGRHDQQRLENLITKADGNLMKAVDLFYGISSSKASSKASHAKPSPSQKKNGKAPVPSKSSPASTILSFFGKPNEATSVPAPRRLVVKHQSSVNGADGAASFARFSTEQHQKYGGISAKRALSPFQGEEMPKHKQQKQQRPARMLSRSDDVICLDDEEEEPAKHKSRGRSTLKSCSNLNFDDKHFPPVCAEEEMQAASAGEFVREGRNLGTDIWSGQEITGLKAITAEEFLTEDEDENCGTEQICISESSSPQARGQKHKAARHQHAAHDEGKDVGEICSSQEEGEEEMSASSQGARPSMISVRQAKAPGRGWSEREEQANNLRRGGKRGEMSGMSAWHDEGTPVKKEQEGGAWIRKGAGCGEQIEGREPGGERVCREEDRNSFKNGNNEVVERRQGIGETGVTSLNCDGEELNSAAGANNIMMCCSASNTSAEAAGIMTDDGSKFYTESYDPVQDACWKSGEKCPYLHLARVYHLIEKERGRLKMGLALCNMFRSILALCPEDMLPAVYLTTGKLAPAHENLELSVGGSLISDAIKEVTGASRQRLSALYKEHGDPGDVAQECRSNQKLLRPPSALTVPSVFQTFKTIAQQEAKGSTARRREMIIKMLRSCREQETRYIVRALCRNMRIGANTTLVLSALAHAVVKHRRDGDGDLTKSPVKKAGKGAQTKKKPVVGEVDEECKRAATAAAEAYAMCPSFDILVPALVEGGIEGMLAQCVLAAGTPIRPMLAKVSTGVEDVFAQMTKRFGEVGELLSEYKYDGQRAVIHVLPGCETVKVFSRHGLESTASYPDVVAVTLQAARRAGVDSAIFDAEVVGVEAGRARHLHRGLLPFQKLSTRNRGSVEASDVQVEVCVFVFDLLLINGEPLVKKTLSERRATMLEVVEKDGVGGVAKGNSPIRGFEVAKSIVVGMQDEEGQENMRAFLLESLQGQAEGLMVKHLNSTGYEPGKRSDSWLKVKKDYVDGLADSLDLVPIGAWWGNGRKAGWFSPWLMAAYDQESGELQSVCKVMSGFTDAFYKEQTARFKELIVEDPKPHYRSGLQPSVWFDTTDVWEIRGAEITVSPVHMAGVNQLGDRGLALRFPRFLRIRDDKLIEDATSSDQIIDMHQKQASLGQGGAGKGGGESGSAADDLDE